MASTSATQLAVPPSPSSSKRSRSRDSAATSTLSTPFFTPSASAPSLIIPSTSDIPAMTESSHEDATPYPAFLQLSRAEISEKFEHFEEVQRERHNPSVADPEESARWARCSPEQVAGRSRYTNVEAYGNNRVRLEVPEGHNDFINASPIELTSTKSGHVLKYIATQGPKFDTYNHFWRMLWHETTSPAVVVMLTRTHEMGRERCFPYFPQTTDAPQIKLNTANEFEDDFVHDLNMTSLVEDESVRAQVRELNMTTEDGSETKKIWHLLFAGWPDFGVPEGADWDALTKLIHMSREKNDHNHGNPRIVHCSAGVGRSGTFIALDWLLNELEDGSLDEVDDDYDPVQHVVESMRQQRMWMVQSEPQLVFIYDLIRDRWRDRWVALHAEDAERLGVTHDGEQDQPRLKRQKSVRDEGNEDDRAQLEGELIDAQMEFDKGKT